MKALYRETKIFAFRQDMADFSCKSSPKDFFASAAVVSPPKIRHNSDSKVLYFASSIYREKTIAVFCLAFVIPFAFLGSRGYFLLWLVDPSMTLRRYHCLDSLPEAPTTFRPSAKKKLGGCSVVGKSFTDNKNNSGPSIEHWVTLLATTLVSEIASSTRT